MVIGVKLTDLVIRHVRNCRAHERRFFLQNWHEHSLGLAHFFEIVFVASEGACRSQKECPFFLLLFGAPGSDSTHAWSFPIGIKSRCQDEINCGWQTGRQVIKKKKYRSLTLFCVGGRTFVRFFFQTGLTFHEPVVLLLLCWRSWLKTS